MNDIIPTGLGDLTFGTPKAGTRGRKSIYVERARKIHDLLVANKSTDWVVFREGVSPASGTKVVKTYSAKFDDCEFMSTSTAGVATVWMRLKP